MLDAILALAPYIALGVFVLFVVFPVAMAGSRTRFSKQATLIWTLATFAWLVAALIAPLFLPEGARSIAGQLVFLAGFALFGIILEMVMAWRCNAIGWSRWWALTTPILPFSLGFIAWAIMARDKVSQESHQPTQAKSAIRSPETERPAASPAFPPAFPPAMPTQPSAMPAQPPAIPTQKAPQKKAPRLLPAGGWSTASLKSALDIRGHARKALGMDGATQRPAAPQKSAPTAWTPPVQDDFLLTQTQATTAPPPLPGQGPAARPPQLPSKARPVDGPPRLPPKLPR